MRDEQAYGHDGLSVQTDVVWYRVKNAPAARAP